MTARRAAAASASLAALAAVLVFLPSLRGGFVSWDDDLFLLGELGWRGLAPANWAFAFKATVGSVWQPLAWLTYGLDYAIWGLDPFGIHLTTVALHAVSAALVALLFLEMPGPKEGPRAFAGAAMAALFFAVHPLRVESVSWAAERRDVLSGMLTFGCLLAYMRGRARLSVALHALACLAKAQAAMIPLFLVVLDYYPLRRTLSVRRYLPFVLTSILTVLMASWAQNRIRWPLIQHGVIERIAQSFYGLAFYVWKSVLPVGLAPLYELRAPLDWKTFPFAASFVAVAVAAAFVWRSRKSHPYLAASAAFYAAALLPVLGLTQFGPQIAADRYSYVSCLPLALLLGALARRRTALLALAGVLAVACVRQQAVWRDSESVWARVAAVDPGSATAAVNLGNLRAARGRIAEARAYFERALTLDGGCVAAQDRLAALRAEGLENGEAAALRWEVEKRPNCRKARVNRAVASAQLGDLAYAEKELTAIVEATPGDQAAWANLMKVQSLRKAARQPR